MQRTIIVLALSSWFAIAFVGCGGADGNNNASSPTPSRSQANPSTTVPSATPADSSATSNGTSETTTCTETRKPVITKPVKGEKVVVTDIIRGTTPCPRMNHYIVVTPMEDGVRWVQRRPASVEADGSFTGEAQFGEGSNGIGKSFLIQILVTRTTLAVGKLGRMPADAILSEAVTVTREQ